MTMNIPSASVATIENSMNNCVRLRGPRNSSRPPSWPNNPSRSNLNPKKPTITSSASGIARFLKKCRKFIWKKPYKSRSKKTAPSSRSTRYVHCGETSPASFSSHVCLRFSHRCGQQTLLGKLATLKLTTHTPLMQHDDPITHSHQLGQFTRNQNHGLALFG